MSSGQSTSTRCCTVGWQPVWFCFLPGPCVLIQHEIYHPPSHYLSPLTWVASQIPLLNAISEILCFLIQWQTEDHSLSFQSMTGQYDLIFPLLVYSPCGLGFQKQFSCILAQVSNRVSCPFLCYRVSQDKSSSQPPTFTSHSSRQNMFLFTTFPAANCFAQQAAMLWLGKVTFQQT